MSDTWTDERVSTLVRYWNAGDSAAIISQKMPGVSRNAILGKVNRLWQARDPRMKRPSGIKPKTLRSMEEIQREADQRSLFILQRREDDGAEFVEIANELGTTVAAVATEYSKIICDLRAREAA